MINIKKPVQTQGGRPARILCANLKDYKWPIVAAVTYDGNNETVHCYQADGASGCASGALDDLVNVPVEHFREVWINFYPGAKGIRPFFSKEEADGCAAPSRIACIRFTATFREGEGI